MDTLRRTRGQNPSSGRNRGGLHEDGADVCVVIVSWNTREMLHRCLASLEGGDEELEVRVVVVDNGSEDGTVRMLLERHSGIRVIANDENRGFAAAVNQGIEVALSPPIRASTVLLLNSDARVSPEAMGRSVRTMLESPRVGALGCRIVGEDGEFQPSCHRFVTLDRLVLSQIAGIRRMAARRGRTLACTEKQHEQSDFDYLKGAFLLLRSDAIRDVGRLDERFFMYAEEADYCLRLRRAGWKLAYLPEVEIVHEGGGSTEGDRDAPVASVNRLVSRLRFLEKHRGATPFRGAVALHLAVNAVRWCTAALLRRNAARNVARRKLRACVSRRYEIPGRG